MSVIQLLDYSVHDLDTFAKLRKMTIHFIMSVCLSVCLSIHTEQLSSQWTYFCGILYLSIFFKICQEYSSFIQSDRNNGYFTWKPIYVYDHILLSFS